MGGMFFLGPQSCFGDKILGVRVVCPQNGTAVLAGLRGIQSRVHYIEGPLKWAAVTGDHSK